MKYKNYYKILGLQSAKVSDEEIKSAYRHLAKQYHPDLNGGSNGVAEKFKDINEAYQVLGDVVSRKKYDRTYFAYKFRDGISGETVKNKINSESGVSDFLTMLFGNKEKKNVVTNFDKYYKENEPIIGEDLDSEIDISLEEAFFGGEKKIAFKTIDNKIRTIKVKIPRGIRTGEKIRLANQGKPGKNGGANGDLYIKVNILKHEKFKLDGSNLLMDLELTPWEAALGTKLEVVGIDSTIYLDVPQCVETGEKLRIANSGYLDGLGGRGDLLLLVKIMIPKKLSEEEKELFFKFKNISTYNPRRD